VILLIDNYDSFTWNLVQRLGEIDSGLELERDLVVVRNDEITAGDVRGLDSGRGPTHVIVSPGPCTPNEAGVSSDVIAEMAGSVPILGVCLGHQCIGDRFGMNVVQHVEPVHGKTAQIEHDGRGLFAGVSQPFVAARYHSLVIERGSIPTRTAGEDGWEVSAWTTERAADGSERVVVMGLRRVWAEGGKDGEGGAGGEARAPLEGVQFHPESFLTTEGPTLLRNFLAMGPAMGSERS
jgi:anthranilate synthase/aminodeoxychorismate synthase-like glutamine amidotransferase